MLNLDQAEHLQVGGETEILLTGSVFTRDEATGEVAPAANATLRFTPTAGGATLVASTNKAGAYAAPLNEGSYHLHVSDDSALSAYAPCERHIQLERGDGQMQRQHVTLAEAPSADQAAYCTAMVYCINNGVVTPIAGAEVECLDCDSGDVVDDNAPPTNASGITFADFSPGDRKAKVTYQSNSKTYACKEYENLRVTSIYLDITPICTC